MTKDSNLTQRDMSKKMGITLGKVNYCVSELAKKGLIKVVRFKNSNNKKAYAYLLTAGGLEEKARLTVHFLKRKLLEYKEVRHQIRELAREAGQENLLDLSKIEM